MTNEDKTKTRPVFAITSGGSAAGSSSYIDTSGWQYAQVMTTFGGAGSATVNIWANLGTTYWTGTVTSRLYLLGSARCDSAGAGTQVFQVGSLTDQAMITHGTCETVGAVNVSYLLFD